MSGSTVAISDLGRVVTGKTPSTKNAAFFDGEYQFVTPSDLDWKTYYCHTTERTVTDDAKKSHLNQFIPSNAVMVTCIGNTIGKCGLSSSDCLTNQQINSIIPSEGIDPKFVYYLLVHNTDSIRGLGLGGGSATPILNKTSFSKIKLRVPPQHQWGSIANTLSAYDDLIENNRRRIQLLEQAARLLYKEWFVHLRFPGHEHTKVVDGVPEGWEKTTIGESASLLSRGIAPKYDDDAPGIVINQKCIRNRMVNLDFARRQSKQVPPSKLVQFGDTLINSTGTGTLGRVAQFLFEIDECTVDSHVTIIRPKENVPSYYFSLHLNSLESYIATLGRGATNQTELSKDDIAALEIVLPSSDFAQIFESIVTPTFRQISILSEQIEKLAKARDLLLPKLMNGEVTV